MNSQGGRDTIGRPVLQPPESTISTKVLLVDDNAMMRDALAHVVDSEADLQVVGAAADAEAGLVMAMATQPDVVVMDVAMPGTNGIEATRELCQQVPDVRVVMLSASCSGPVLRDAFAAGACGYLLKDGSPEAVVEGIRLGAHGGRPLAPLVRKLLEPQ